MERCTVWEGITIEEGTMGDYEAVAGFHYRGGRPRGVVRVWVAAYKDERGDRKVERQKTKDESGVARYAEDGAPHGNAGLSREPAKDGAPHGNAGLCREPPKGGTTNQPEG